MRSSHFVVLVEWLNRWGFHPLAIGGFPGQSSGMRLFQDQLYQKGDQFIRITGLDRYQVEFKTTTGDPKGEGEITVLEKKPFCRLIRGMTLLNPPAAK